MPCLPSSTSADERLFKNEYAVTMTFCGPTAALAQSQAGRLTKAMGALRQVPELADWTLTSRAMASTVSQSASTTSMATHWIVLTHKAVTLTTAAQAAKDIRVLYYALCSKRVRAVLWKEENLFQWKVGLASVSTALENDVWYFSPVTCDKYRTSASAIGNLEFYLGNKYCSSASVSAKNHLGSSAQQSSRECISSLNHEATRAAKEIYSCMTAVSDATGARKHISVLRSADQEMFDILKRTMAAQAGNPTSAKSLGEFDGEKTGRQALRDDVSVDTLVGTCDEVLDDTMTKHGPIKQTRGCFRRLLADYLQKRNTRMLQNADVMLAVAEKKMEKLHTALERMRGYYLYSAKLHAHIMTEEAEFTRLAKAAVLECGWANVNTTVLHHLRGDLSGLMYGDKKGLGQARHDSAKELKKMQGKYSELSAEVARLLDDSASLRAKAGAAH